MAEAPYKNEYESYREIQSEAANAISDSRKAYDRTDTTGYQKIVLRLLVVLVKLAVFNATKFS